MTEHPPESPTAVIDAALEASGYRARVHRLRQRHRSFSPDLVEELRQRAGSQMRKSPKLAGQLARMGILVANSIDHPPGRIACLRALAQANTLAGSYPAALKALAQALAEPRESRDEVETAEIEALRVGVLAHLERYAEARETGRRALEVFERLENAQGILRVRMTLAELAFRTDRPREALRHYNAIDAVLGNDTPPRVRATIAVNRANALDACNRFRAAARHYEIARRIFEVEGCEHTVAQVDYNAAYAEFLRSRYEAALRRYARTEETFLRLDDERHLAHTDLDRAEIHLHLNLPDDALEFALSALERFRKLELVKEGAQAAHLAGRAHELNGNAADASLYYADAQMQFAEIGLREREVGCRVQRGHLSLASGHAGEARRLAIEAKDGLDGDMNALTGVSVELLLTALDLTAGRAPHALTRVEGVLEVCRRIHAPWALVEAYRMTGRVHLALDHLDEAVRSYQQAIEHLERYRGGVPPDEYMAAFLAGRSGLYADIVSLLVRAGDAELAFEFVERAKSRALVDLLAGQPGQVGTPARGSPSVRRVRYLRERLGAVYQRLFHTVAEPGSPAARSVRQIRALAEEYEQEIGRLLRAERMRDPEALSLEAVDAPDLATLRRGLEPDTHILEYYLTPEGLFTFVVTRERMHVVHQDVSEETLRRGIERFHFHLSKYQRPHESEDELTQRATRANLEDLARILLAPIEEHLDGKRLVVVPHGVLHHLPFHALPLAEGWVADRFEVVYAPSAAVYGYCARKGEPATGAPCVFGLPDEVAPRIAEEVDRVAELLGGARVFLDENATLERLRHEATDARVIHIATHGMFRHSEPMLSSIRMADRWVNLYDLYGLDVNGELVVLSTCESGVADVTEGNEILGLTRGFLYAGARALLTSQWRVDDAVTSEFMERFYVHLAQHEDAAAAHRHAMRDVRAAHPHPYFWAPFFLTGRPVASSARRAHGPSGPRLEEPSHSSQKETA